MSDEHQSRLLGCANHNIISTPNLDKLASRGTRFANAYTPSPICVPARASFATGQYAHTNRLWDNAMPYTGDIPGWGHALQTKGIPVESIGKLHYRQQEDEDGFDEKHLAMMVVDGIGMVWASVRRENERRINTGPDRMLGNYIGPGTSKYTEYDAAVTERAIQWLKAVADHQINKPWCLYVGLVAPHFPLVVPQEWFDMYPTDRFPDVKLHPKDGYTRHPWVEKQNDFMDNESKFKDSHERAAAVSAYYGLVSWMDHNVGLIMSALEEAGLADSTDIIYTSDHGDNIGARGLWGKSNHYEEAVAVPLIFSGSDMPVGVCDTPVSLIDLAPTIVDHFDTELAHKVPGESLFDVMREPHDSERVVFSEYHAAGATSGAFMLRKGSWKYIYYVGFEPELFNLEKDPEEIENLSGVASCSEKQAELHQELLNICDPELTNQQAFADQDAMIASFGGREVAMKLGAPGATPAPEVK